MPAKRDKGIPPGHQMENRNRLSVIISVQQDEKTIRRVIRQVERLLPKEIVIILHGSQDQSVDLVLQSSLYERTCLIYPFPLGDDLWRSIGAKEVTGDVWLFLSGDRVILAEELVPFVRACYQGIDIALRKEEAPLVQPGTVTLAKSYINCLLDQKQLGVSSVCELPFAITKTAATSIGVDHLFTPPLAQVIAMKKGLRIEAVPHRIKEAVQGKHKRHAAQNRMKQWTRLGDHMEAVAYWNEQDKTGR